jgi:hypothetical protein
MEQLGTVIRTPSGRGRLYAQQRLAVPGAAVRSYENGRRLGASAEQRNPFQVDYLVPCSLLPLLRRDPSWRIRVMSILFG